MIRFDCHAHVYERITPVEGARYAPERPASLHHWLAQQKQAGLSGGVIVQISFLGTDNSQMLGALSRLDRNRFAGIACVPLDAPEVEIAELAAAGVRGIRWNLVAGAPLPDPRAREARRLLDMLAAHDMHLEVQLESTRWVGYLDALSTAPVPVVIDHLGLPEGADAIVEPWLTAIETCTRRERFYVKASAPYRGSVDARGHLDTLDRAIRLLGPNRVIWGSDWPHTRFEKVATYDGLYDEVAGRIDDRDAAQALYDIG